MRATRIATWVIAGAVAILSLAPGAVMVPIGRGTAEHFAAYAVFAAVAGIGYGRHLGFGWLLLIAVTLAAILESAQALAAGRTPTLLDFAASAGGSSLGILIAAGLRGRRTVNRD